MTTRPGRAPSYPRPSPAARRRCPRCKARIWSAFDSPVAGLLVDVDPVALDPVGEMLALLAGCRTVELEPDGRLARRGSREIAAGQRHPVLATHRCDRTNNGRELTNPVPTVPVIHTAADNESPPF